MKKKDLLLTGLLLLLIGATAGTLFALYTYNDDLAPLAEVKTTEITKNDSPLITEEALAGMDTRFLFRRIAEEVTPTVVFIEALIPVEESMPDDGNHEFSPEDEEGSDEEGGSIWDRILPRRARTVGSGVLITTDGYILTNYHVIEGAVRKGLRVVLNDKREYIANVVGYDPSTDLAVIKIDEDNLPAVTVGDSETVNVGEWVMAIGNPFRLRSTVTAGIVSALSRDVQIINDRMRVESFIQTDAAINKGNSGGALVNTSGQLIGINTAIASQTGAYQGYGFAVPSNLAIKVAKDIIEYGEVRRALLGVTITAVDYTRAVEKGMESVRGVEIMSISDGGAADRSGLRSGDVVLKVNGKEVNESNELQQYVAVLRPGETVDLQVLREGEVFDKTVTLNAYEPEEIPEIAAADEPLQLEEIPDDNNQTDSGEGAEAPSEETSFDSGFTVTKENRFTQNGNTRTEIRVSEVDRYSEAWNRGLRSGFTIISISREKVEDLGQLEELMRRNLEQNGSVLLGIKDQDNALGFIELKN